MRKQEEENNDGSGEEEEEDSGGECSNSKSRGVGVKDPSPPASSAQALPATSSSLSTSLYTVQERERRMFDAFRADIDGLARAYFAAINPPPTTTLQAAAGSSAGGGGNSSRVGGGSSAYPQTPTLIGTAGSSGSGDDYGSFHSLFVSRQLHTIFAGRFSGGELMEFSEHLLQYAAFYMFPQDCVDGGDEATSSGSSIDGKEGSSSTSYFAGSPCRLSMAYRQWLARQRDSARRYPRTLAERIFGIYLTYTLYFLQPSDHVQMVRVSVAQMRSLNSLLEELRMPRGGGDMVEATFCLMRLVCAHAFSVVPMEIEFNPLVCRHPPWHYEEDSRLRSIESLQDLVDLNSLKQLLPMFSNMDRLHEHYVRQYKEIALIFNQHAQVSAAASSSRTRMSTCYFASAAATTTTRMPPRFPAVSALDEQPISDYLAKLIDSTALELHQARGDSEKARQLREEMRSGVHYSGNSSSSTPAVAPMSFKQAVASSGGGYGAGVQRDSIRRAAYTSSVSAPQHRRRLAGSKHKRLATNDNNEWAEMEDGGEDGKGEKGCNMEPTSATATSAGKRVRREEKTPIANRSSHQPEKKGKPTGAAQTVLNSGGGEGDGYGVEKGAQEEISEVDQWEEEERVLLAVAASGKGRVAFTGLGELGEELLRHDEMGDEDAAAAADRAVDAKLQSLCEKRKGWVGSRSPPKKTSSKNRKGRRRVE